MKHMHTVIEDPLQLRKEILESALESTKALQSTEALKSMGSDMAMFRKELKMMVKTLKSSANALHQVLPALPPEFHEKRGEELKRGLERPVPSEQGSEQPSLSLARSTWERDLEEIRQKIKTLSR